MEETTLYRKVGKRYVKHDTYLNDVGLPCGLYLFYKPNHKGEHQAMMSMMHYAKVHEIQNVSKFSDLFVQFHDLISKTILENKEETADFISKEIIAKISNIENL